MTALQRHLRDALGSALRRRDHTAAAALRTALTAIANAEAVDPAPEVAGPVVGRSADVARNRLTDAQVVEILRAEIADELASADAYARHGRAEQAAELRARAAVLTGQIDPIAGESDRPEPSQQRYR